MHNSKAGIAFVGMGVVLILSALLLFLYNEGRNAAAEKANEDIYADLYRIIEQQKEARDTETEAVIPEETAIVQAEIPETEEALPAETEMIPEAPVMETVTVDGHDYIGILEIPSLELTVPILSDWDERKLDIAPCRHFGSVGTDDLVIAGHNYRRHFLYLYQVKAGDQVFFTCPDGTLIEYEAAEIRTLDAADVESVLDSKYDLILYTCTYSGTERTAVFCRKTVQE